MLKSQESNLNLVGCLCQIFDGIACFDGTIYITWGTWVREHAVHSFEGTGYAISHYPI